MRTRDERLKKGQDKGRSSNQVLSLQTFDQARTLPDLTFERIPLHHLRLPDRVLIIRGVDPFGHADLAASELSGKWFQS
jgi:hypothetical protein